MARQGRAPQAGFADTIPNFVRWAGLPLPPAETARMLAAGACRATRRPKILPELARGGGPSVGWWRRAQRRGRGACATVAPAPPPLCERSPSPRKSRGGLKVTPSGNPPVNTMLPRMTDRPQYDPAFIETARTLAARGAMDHDIAVALGIELRTLVEWQAIHPAFGEACIVPREAADAAVEAAIYRLATGFSYEAERVWYSHGNVMQLPYVAHVPPDDRAIIWWLTHRRPDEWRDLRPPRAPRAPRDKAGGDLSDRDTPASPATADDAPAPATPAASVACTGLAPASCTAPSVPGDGFVMPASRCFAVRTAPRLFNRRNGPPFTPPASPRYRPGRRTCPGRACRRRSAAR